MKTNKLIFPFLMFLVISVGCDTKGKSENDKKEQKMEVKKENIVGGWTKMEVNDKVKEIVDYVISSKQVESKVIKITDASSQVVSGRNYGFKLHLENGEIWNAKVYENLKKEKQITLFEKTN